MEQRRVWLSTWTRALLDAVVRGDMVIINSYDVSHDTDWVISRFEFCDGNKKFRLNRPRAFNFILEELDYPTAEAWVFRDRGPTWHLVARHLFDSEGMYNADI